MSDMSIIVLAILWWTFAVSALAIAASHEGTMHWRVIGYALFWPMPLPVIAVFLTYDMTVKSTKRLRADLQNRKLLREFDAYMRKKKEQTT